MAKESEQLKTAGMLPTGMDDNLPLSADASWYQTNGIFSQGQLFLQRCNGKLLINKFSAPVLAIHGDLRGRVFIETTEAIYMFVHLDDAIPT